MQYIVVFKPKQRFRTDGMPPDFPEVERQEQARARALYAEGGLRQVWALDTEDRGAAVLFKAESPAHLRTMIDSFPLIKAGYADHQVLPLAPYPAFAAAS